MHSVSGYADRYRLCIEQQGDVWQIVDTIDTQPLLSMGALVQLVEYRTRTKRLRVRLTPGPLQATLSKLLTYCVLRPTQPPTLSGMGNEYGYGVKA